MVRTQPELLAHHLTEAGQPAQAVAYWQRAGENAVARSAHLEAISQLTTGLAVLQTLPETAERIQQELLLQITLGPALMNTKGFAAPEAEHAYAPARGRDAPALLRTARTLAVLQRPGDVPDRARAGGAVSPAGAAGRRLVTPAGGSPCALDHQSPDGRAAPCAHPLGAGLSAPRPPAAPRAGHPPWA